MEEGILTMQRLACLKKQSWIGWAARRRWSLLAVLAGLLLSLNTQAASAKDGENIAPSAPYNLTPAPNYDLATGAWNKVLNDERRGSGWTGSKVVGWYWKSPIIYRQEFQTSVSIRSVELGTFQGTRSDVGIPANAFVYVQVPDGRWAYVGDAAQAAPASEGAQTLSLSFAPLDVKSVLIVIFRSAPYLMLDEVRIIAAGDQGKSPVANVVADAIDDAIQRRRTYAEQRAGLGPRGAEPAARLAWPLDAAVAGDAGCRVTKIAPWTESTPADIAAAKADSTPYVHAVGGWVVGLVRIENLSAEPVKVEFHQTRAEGVAPPEILIAHYVLALDYRWRADVLVPNDSITLPPRSMGVAVIRARALKAGEVQTVVGVSCGKDRQDIRIDGHVIETAPEDRPFGTTWSYLKGPARNLPRCGSQINDDAWIDTAVVDEAALLPRQAGRTSALLRTYLRTFSTSRRLLLFMDVTDSAWVSDSGSQFEEQLRAWWTWVSKAIREEGYKGEVMFYPVDEGRGANVDRLNTAADALRRIAPSVPIYATIDDISAAYAAKIDVPQYLDRVLTRHPPRPSRNYAPQIYATDQYTKTLGLSTYFRRMPWLAFGENWDGAGVWSMWDSNGADKPKIGWTDFGGLERDFALIYADQTGCPLPSRRLLAFQRGLEDFALMRACARRSASSQIREMARSTAQSSQWDDIRRNRTEAAPDFDKALAQMADACTARQSSD